MWHFHYLHAPPRAGGGQGGKMMDIAYLVAIMADLTSETWYELPSDAPGYHVVLYRTEIHATLAKISKMFCLGFGRFWVHLPGNVVENGVVSEDWRSNRVL